MRQPVSFDDAMERDLEAIAHTVPHAVWATIQRLREAGRSDEDIHLVLAVASAKWVDHRGPLVGHGTFNGGPMLRASHLLKAPYRDLALLQTAVYVIELLRDPNYGPYLMLAMDPIDEADADTALARFYDAVMSGLEPYRAEHRVVGLARRLGPAVRWPLTRMALRPYPENEHRLLIVHRMGELLDDTNGWGYGQWLSRSAVQYLASRPDSRIYDHEASGMTSFLLSDREPGAADAEAGRQLAQELMACEAGEEPALIRAGFHAGLPVPAMRAAISAAASSMMLRSGYDAHAVTGVHCAGDLLASPAVPDDIRRAAAVLALSSQRTRREKARRTDWAALPRPGSATSDQTAVLRAVKADGTGLAAAQAAADYLAEGGDPCELACGLMEVALETAGPFDAIHNVKMLWGLYRETLAAPRAQAWVHLAAGARAVAMTAFRQQAEAARVLQQWPATPQHQV